MSVACQKTLCSKSCCTQDRMTLYGRMKHRYGLFQGKTGYFNDGHLHGARDTYEAPGLETCHIIVNMKARHGERGSTRGMAGEREIVIGSAGAQDGIEGCLMPGVIGKRFLTLLAPQGMSQRDAWSGKPVVRQ